MNPLTFDDLLEPGGVDTAPSGVLRFDDLLSPEPSQEAPAPQPEVLDFSDLLAPSQAEPGAIGPVDLSETPVRRTPSIPVEAPAPRPDPDGFFVGGAKGLLSGALGMGESLVGGPITAAAQVADEATPGLTLPNPIKLPFEDISEAGQNISRFWREAAERMSPEAAEDETFKRLFFMASQSAPETLGILATGIVTGGVAPAMGALAVASGGRSFAKADEKGVGLDEKLKYAGVDMIANVVPEILPLGFLLKYGGKGAIGRAVRRFFGDPTLSKRIGGALLTELPTEQVTTFIEVANDMALSNPDMTLGEALKQTPSNPEWRQAAVDTAGVTAIMAPVMGGATHLALGKPQQETEPPHQPAPTQAMPETEAIAPEPVEAPQMEPERTQTVPEGEMINEITAAEFGQLAKQGKAVEAAKHVQEGLDSGIAKAAEEDITRNAYLKELGEARLDLVEGRISPEEYGSIQSRIMETEQEVNKTLMKEPVYAKEEILQKDDKNAYEEGVQEGAQGVDFLDAVLVSSQKPEAPSGAVGAAPTIGRITKTGELVRGPSVKKVLGIKDDQVTLPEKSALKAMIQAEAKGAKAGEKQGVVIGQGQVFNKMSLKMEKAVNKERVKALRDVIRLRWNMTKIISTLKSKSKTTAEVKSLIYKEAKKLPADVRASLLPDVANAKTKKDLDKSLRKIMGKHELVQKRRLAGEVKKYLSKANSLPVRWQKKMEAYLKPYVLKGMSGKTEKKLASLKEFLDKNPDSIFSFGGKTISQVKKISRLGKEKVSDLELRRLEELVVNLESAYVGGKLENKLRKEIEVLQRDKLLEELQSTSRNVDRKAPRSIAFKKSKRAQWGDKRLQIEEQLMSGYMNFVSVDIVMEILDRYKRFGANYRTFKQPFDKAFWAFKDAKAGLVKRYLSAKKAIEKETGIKFEDFNMERIMIYATRMQVGGLEKMKRSGVADLLEGSGETLEGLTLTDSEMALYKEMRSIFDELRPGVAATLQKTKGEELDQAENYFSWQTDFDNSDPVHERLASDYTLSSRTEQGFTKQRTLFGRQVLKFNAEEVFLKNVDDSTYFIHTEELLNNIGKTARTEEYKKAVGAMGQRYVMGWIDLMARKGVPKGYRPGIVMTVLRNTGAGILGFRLSPIAKQPLAKVDAMALIGQHAFIHDVTFFKEGLWEHVPKNSPQQKHRVLDDPLFREMSKNKTLAKWQERSYLGIKFVDAITAHTVWYGAYQKYLSDNGIKFDLADFKAGKVNDKGREYADFIARRTQGSGEAKDLASMLTGKNKTTFKAIFQFQNFILNASYLIPHEMINKSIRTEGNYPKAIGILMAYVLGGLAEEYVGTGIAQFFSSEKYAKKAREKELAARITEGFVTKMPILNNIYGMVKYDGVGVPTIDVAKSAIGGTTSLVTGKKTETKIKGASRAVESVGSLLGVPGSGQMGQIFRKGYDMYNDSGEPERRKFRQFAPERVRRLAPDRRSKNE